MIKLFAKDNSQVCRRTYLTVIGSQRFKLLEWKAHRIDDWINTSQKTNKTQYWLNVRSFKEIWPVSESFMLPNHVIHPICSLHKPPSSQCSHTHAIEGSHESIKRSVDRLIHPVTHQCQKEQCFISLPGTRFGTFTRDRDL